jgi:hypothetical protein
MDDKIRFMALLRIEGVSLMMWQSSSVCQRERGEKSWIPRLIQVRQAIKSGPEAALGVLLSMLSDARVRPLQLPVWQRVQRISWLHRSDR